MLYSQHLNIYCVLYIKHVMYTQDIYTTLAQLSNLAVIMKKHSKFLEKSNHHKPNSFNPSPPPPPPIQYIIYHSPSKSELLASSDFLDMSVMPEAEDATEGSELPSPMGLLESSTIPSPALLLSPPPKGVLGFRKNLGNPKPK